MPKEQFQFEPTKDYCSTKLHALKGLRAAAISSSETRICRQPQYLAKVDYPVYSRHLAGPQAGKIAPSMVPIALG
jgi:hypothetical protein